MVETPLNIGRVTTSQTNGTPSPSGPVSAEKAREAASEFEAVFLSQVLATMTQELGGAGSVAGDGGDVYQDMFNKEVAKMISRSGGIGVADTILQEMLKLQEIE